MSAIDIIILVSAVSVILGIIGVIIYKNVKGIPIDTCGCKSKRKVNKMLKEVRRELEEEKQCCCSNKDNSNCCCNH